MKGYKKLIISIIVFIVISVIMLATNMKGESFNNTILSNFDNKQVQIVSIIDSLQINNVLRTTDDYEVINNLLEYLNSLNLKRIYFKHNKDGEIRYRIALTGKYDKNNSGFIMLEMNRKKIITVYSDLNQKKEEKIYKIINTEIDYNKLDEIFNMIEQ